MRATTRSLMRAIARSIIGRSTNRSGTIGLGEDNTVMISDSAGSITGGLMTSATSGHMYFTAGLHPVDDTRYELKG